MAKLKKPYLGKSILNNDNQEREISIELEPKRDNRSSLLLWKMCVFQKSKEEILNEQAIRDAHNKTSKGSVTTSTYLGTLEAKKFQETEQNLKF